MTSNTRLAYLLLINMPLLFLLWSCSGSSKIPDVGPGKTTPQDQADCLDDYPVNSGAADIMRNAWEYALESNHTVPVHANHLYRSFPRADIETLLAQCVSCNGVRAYFAYDDDPNSFPEAPNLVLVNTDGCSDDVTQNVLRSNSDATPGGQFIPVSEAEELTEEWVNALSQYMMEKPGWVYDEIRAYTFYRENFTDILDDPNHTHIRFYYALAIENKKDQSPTDPEGVLRIDIIMEGHPVNVNSAAPYVDFALPCPQACDGNSPLNHGN